MGADTDDAPAPLPCAARACVEEIAGPPGVPGGLRDVRLGSELEKMNRITSNRKEVRSQNEIARSRLYRSRFLRVNTKS